MIATVLLAQVMLYMVLCVGDIVAIADACQNIIPVAIFGLLQTICSQCIFSNNICLIHDCHCFTCPGHVAHGTM